MDITEIILHTPVVSVVTAASCAKWWLLLICSTQPVNTNTGFSSIPSIVDPHGVPNSVRVILLTIVTLASGRNASPSPSLKYRLAVLSLVYSS